ncbi:hypothetical protein PCCS19_28580 [Paenibacillus sp. CCS19]|uniref:hypothetical protein n=1 Tax=Paenibacillus sp. CCS19 TaxID=3158387 RepID=UPI00256E64D4|nr:hypothetical protein [Paenibacillus cellulosilyticus]GMK39803.1 hypothetical protein PCCS19_28580 [Paenibacillus cellulosilyticus]
MPTAQAPEPIWKQASVRSRRNLLLFLVFAACIYIVDFLLIRIVPVLPSEADSRWLVGAIFFDYVILVPILYYTLVIRKQDGRWSAWQRVLPIAALGGLIVLVALPSSMHGAVIVAEMLLLPIEAVFLTVELRMAITVFRTVRRLTLEGRPFPDALHAALSSGRLAAYIRHDLLVLYYLFGSWRKRKSIVDQSAAAADEHFTYHHQTSLFLFSAMLTKVLVIESIVVHILVARLNDYAAWILTAGSLWIIALLWTDCRRSVLEPIRLTEEGIDLKYGLRLNGPIPYSAIDRVHSGIDLQPTKEERKRSAVAPMVTPNIRITLRNAVTLEGLLMQPQEVHAIYIAVDSPAAFVESLRRRLL